MSIGGPSPVDIHWEVQNIVSHCLEILYLHIVPTLEIFVQVVLY